MEEGEIVEVIPSESRKRFKPSSLESNSSPVHVSTPLLDEEEIIKQQRLRRQAILSKYKNQPSIQNQKQDEKEDSVLNLFQNYKLKTSNDSDECIAAEYDPNMDKKQELNRTRLVEPTLSLKQQLVEPQEEKEEDDMFAPELPIDKIEKERTSHILESAPVLRAQGTTLTDNWDDEEGYYNIILGEVLMDRYHVYANLGKGVFSSVVKASDRACQDVDVAIKIIRNNDLMYQAGLKEWSILQKLQENDPLDKKHIIRAMSYFEHKNHLCIIFESLGMNLRQLLKKYGKDNGLHIKAVRAYGQQLCQSLGLLRKCNLIHADIKPDNILVSESKSTLKLCDLGSASDVSENEITPYLVSRFYRAPEIILGLPYDFGIDIWSLACTLYELYTGKILFPGKTNNDMLKLIMDAKGRIPNKLLKKSDFSTKYFDENLNFIHYYQDKISGKTITKNISYLKPSKDFKARLLFDTSDMPEDEVRLVTNFVDFLEKALNLNPEKRLTIQEALIHPFIYGNISKKIS